MRNMTETRSEKISVVLTPSTLRQLDAYAAKHRWSRSAAVAALIEDGLSRQATEEGIKE